MYPKTGSLAVTDVLAYLALMTATFGADGRYVVEDLIRTPTLAALLGLLVLAAALGRWKGLRAVIGAGA